MPITPKIASAMAEATTRHNDRLAEKNPFFDKVMNKLNEAESLRIGDRLIVSSGELRDKPIVIYIVNDQGFVKLFVKVNGWTAPPVHLGYWTSHGKQITAELVEFNIWHTRTRTRIAKMESNGDL